MNIDTLLHDADPATSLTARERAELDRMIEAVRPERRRPRARFVIVAAALSALLLAGGGAAAAATGLWHPSWYDPASDWTTDAKTVTRVFAVDGSQYHCTVDFTLESTYNGKGTPDFQKALSYLRSLDPTTVTPSPSEINDYLHPTWVGQGPAPKPPSKVWTNEQVWIIDVGTRLNDHISAIGLDPEKIRLLTQSTDCNFTR